MKNKQETTCERCAKCCYEKIEDDDGVFISNIPCKFLDLSTNLCKVYDHRHEAHIRCMTVEQGIKVHAFPASCPYVKNIDGYIPPIELNDKSEIDELVMFCENDTKMKDNNCDKQ